MPNIKLLIVEKLLEVLLYVEIEFSLMVSGTLKHVLLFWTVGFIMNISISFRFYQYLAYPLQKFLFLTKNISLTIYDQRAYFFAYQVQ